MVNVRPHDPYSPHTEGSGIAVSGDTDPNAPLVPTQPGQHPAPPVTQPPVTDPPSDADAPGDGLDDMLKADLVDLAERSGLSTAGNKPDLITRIREHRASR